jgi:hypothetical protein
MDKGDQGIFIHIPHDKKIDVALEPNDEIHSERYSSLEVYPGHIHKDKKAHKDALLTLGDEIVIHIHEQSVPVVNDFSDITATKVATGH